MVFFLLLYILHLHLIVLVYKIELDFIKDRKSRNMTFPSAFKLICIARLDVYLFVNVGAPFTIAAKALFMVILARLLFVFLVLQMRVTSEFFHSMCILALVFINTFLSELVVFA